MKNGIILSVITVGISLFVSSYSQAQIKNVTYEVSARNMSLKAVNSYPQKLMSVQRDDSVYKVVINTFAAYDNEPMREIARQDRYIRDYAYPDSVSVFLEPTFLTDCTLPKIKFVADSILNCGDTLSLGIIYSCLKYTSKCIKFDNELAQELDQGRSTTLDVKTIFQTGKGTCSEYTNVFISLMRAVKIPCRMVVGYVYMPEHNFEGSHAWAECYIKDYGWLAVDPQNAFYWYPSFAIKLFYGRDFIDCNIKTLPDMYPVKVKILDTDTGNLNI